MQILIINKLFSVFVAHQGEWMNGSLEILCSVHCHGRNTVSSVQLVVTRVIIFYNETKMSIAEALECKKDMSSCKG